MTSKSIINSILSSPYPSSVVVKLGVVDRYTGGFNIDPELQECTDHIEKEIAMWERIRKEAEEEDEMHYAMSNSACYCSATKHPPCGVCENGIEENKEDSNDD